VLHNCDFLFRKAIKFVNQDVDLSFKLRHFRAVRVSEDFFHQGDDGGFLKKGGEGVDEEILRKSSLK